MKDLISTIVFLVCLTNIYKSADVLSLYIAGIILIVFFTKYLRTKKVLREYNLFFKNSLKKQKDEFLDILNHDIKVPALAQLRGLEVLKNGIMGEINNDQKELIEQIESSCEYTLDMISMLINTHKIENNSSKLNYENFNITDLLFSCFNELSANAKEKNLTFSYRSDTKEHYIEADRAEIKKVILNLLLNAINYSSFGENILVDINSDGNSLEFTVAGMGLLNMTNGQSIECERRKKYSTIGHSIGMYLCKKIIEFHKGKFFVSQNAENSLSFMLPRKLGAI